MVTITEATASKLKDIARETGVEPLLRAGVKGGGCAGYSYFFEFIELEDITEMDTICEQHGVKIYIDMLSDQYLDGMSIDYIDEGLLGGGFKFNNPNAKQTCGCGSSFSA